MKMGSIKKISQTHILVILIGLTAGVLVAAPHLQALRVLGADHFQGVYPLFSDDEVTYLARIKELHEGHFTLGNPYLKEHMNDPFIMPPISEGFFALAAKLTGVSVPFVMSVSDGVFGFICFVLIYIVFYTITKSTWISVLYSLVFFIFSLSTFGRPISPQFNAVFLFTGLILIARTYFNKELWGRKWNVIVGLVTGITCFISPYYFTALLGFYVIVFTLRALCERDKTILYKNVTWFLLSFLPLACTYAFFQIKASLDPSYGETVLRYGLMHTHIPGSFTNVFFGVIACGVLFLCFKSLSNQKFIFALGALVTIFALNLQNILTGKSLQFSSHYLFTTIFFVCMTFSVIHAGFASKEMWNMRKFRKGLVIGGMLCVVAVIGHNQKGEFINFNKQPSTCAELLRQQEKMEVFAWLNEHTEVDDVVYTLGGEYDFLLPVYTHNKVFYNFYAALYPAFNAELEERWIIQNIFHTKMNTTTLRDRQREYWGNMYIDSYQSRENRQKIYAFIIRTPYIPGTMIPEEKVSYMYNRWVDIGERSIEQNFSQYEIDYILLSQEYPDYENALRMIDGLKFATLRVEINGVRIYSYDK